MKKSIGSNNIDSKNGGANSVNFLQVMEGGHCMYCHTTCTKGYQCTCAKAKKASAGKEWVAPTSCTKACGFALWQPHAHLEDKVNYIIELLEKRK